MKNYIIYTVSIMLISIGISPSLFAVADTSIPASTVAAINTVAIANDATVPNIGTTAAAAVIIFDVIFSNNDVDGYTIVFSSAKAGQLRNTGTDDDSAVIYNSSDAGTYLDYTLTSVNNTSAGTLGEDLSLTHMTGHDLVADKTFTFNNPGGATYQMKWDIKLTTIASNILIAGTYNDTITVTLADI